MPYHGAEAFGMGRHSARKLRRHDHARSRLVRGVAAVAADNAEYVGANFDRQVDCANDVP